jgi:hypothetical protein
MRDPAAATANDVAHLAGERIAATGSTPSSFAVDPGLSKVSATSLTFVRSPERGEEMNPGKLAWHDQHDAWIADTIRQTGWAINYIGGDSCSRPGCRCEPDEGPPFGYTVGLFGLGHPELLVFGLDPTTTSQLLNTSARGSKRVVRPSWQGSRSSSTNGRTRSCRSWCRIQARSCSRANRFYQRPDEASVPVLQLSYNDPDGRYPWEDEYAAPHLQTRPGSFRA